jgi:hypothetical protein
MKKIYITEPSEIVGPRVYKDKKRAHSKIDPGHSTDKDITYVSNELRPIPHPKVEPSTDPSEYIEQKAITRKLIPSLVRESLIHLLPSSTIDDMVKILTIETGSLEGDAFYQLHENLIIKIEENSEAWNKGYKSKDAASIIRDRLENLSSTESIRGISRRTGASRSTIERVLSEFREVMTGVAQKMAEKK